ncbi:KpsF/GutQ family sugar-phosphate isomerase [Sinorhizobium meliloti]|uniref:KpsF/GutQ family sugar-phosphate isomerase n=1 Tax=Rhizobium meliloti TaxID=382 RepID=UPI0023801250|nr:KpsF/GutQ family sugar-phosphate isomerase [Sinorhizobium meliloti]MDE3759827.1 KpsF/GutQ family sugar-phosphate isomerase [Sinorhizobium meliloti]
MAVVSQGRTTVHPRRKPVQQSSECGKDDVNSRSLMLMRVKAIIRQEATALERLSERIDDHICMLVDYILASTGIVVVCGIGKSRLVGEKISATLASTGTRSITLDATDALHGDLGRVRAGDVIIVLSNSGETAELMQLVRAVRQLSVKIAAITGRANSSLAQAADFAINIGPIEEACALGLAPTTSTTAMAAIGDAVALVLQERRGFTRRDYARLHPGGTLGLELMRVRDLMWPLDAIPVFRPDTPLSRVLLSMCGASRKSGVAVIVDERPKAVGILIGETVRRSVERGAAPDLNDPVERYMQHPIAPISGHAFVAEAARLFCQQEAELMPVQDEQQRFVGLICREDALKPSWTGDIS